MAQLTEQEAKDRLEASPLRKLQEANKPIDLNVYLGEFSDIHCSDRDT